MSIKSAIEAIGLATTEPTGLLTTGATVGAGGVIVRASGGAAVVASG
jgi:hypothetical protein